MILAIKKVIPPKEWQHSPELHDKWLRTVAMNLAEN